MPQAFLLALGEFGRRKGNARRQGAAAQRFRPVEDSSGQCAQGEALRRCAGVARADERDRPDLIVGGALRNDIAAANSVGAASVAAIAKSSGLR